MIPSAIQDACTLLLTHEPWYGHAAMEIHWIANNSISTMGVRLRADAEIECLYNEDFVARLSLRHLYAVIQHELDHVFLGHLLRCQSFEPELWNIAADMVVNGRRDHPRIGYDTKTYGAKALPMDENICWIPKHFPEECNAETYYGLLRNRLEQLREQNSDVSPAHEGKQERKSQALMPAENEVDTYLKPLIAGTSHPDRFPWQMDHHEVWSQGDSPVDQESYECALKNLRNRLGPKSRGQGSGDVSERISETTRSQVSWKSVLRSFIARCRMRGRKKSSPLRRNRRIDIFGLPGTIPGRRLRASVVVDTSGSVSSEELRLFFSEMEILQNQCTFSVLQWDHAFQGFWPEYKKGDYKRIQLKGRGGTDMVAPVKWLMQKSLLADCVIMFTDGYCNFPSPFGVPLLVVLTNENMTPPDWIRTARITHENGAR